MKYFYDQKYENDSKVRETWYTYVIKFLPLVNRHWKNLISNDKVAEKPSMFLAITVSDEALVRWFIILWLKTLNDIKDKKKSEEEQSKGKGPHDTRANKKLYTIIHNEIESSRDNHYQAVRWNQIFWEEVTQRNADLFTERKESSKYSSIKAVSNELPLPGLNVDQEFLASFSLESCAPQLKATINDENIHPI